MASEICFILSGQDYVDAARADYRRRMTSARLLACLVGFSGLVAFSASRNLEQLLLIWLGYAGLIVFLMIGGDVLVARRARRMFEQQKMNPQVWMSWTEEGVKWRHDFGSFASQWPAFYGWRETKTCLMLLINAGYHVIIPKRAMESETAKELRETLERSGLARC